MVVRPEPTWSQKKKGRNSSALASPALCRHLATLPYRNPAAQRLLENKGHFPCSTGQDNPRPALESISQA